MTNEEFITKLQELNLSFNNEMLSQLEQYADFLMEYNKHTNLTAIKDKKDIYCKHFYDSLTLVKATNLNEAQNLMDFGTGAGFPGVVLKIFFPGLEVTLVDSNNKKTNFLNELTKKLGLAKVHIINDRVENLWSKYLNSYDIVTARAVSNMTVLTELAMPLVKKGGYFIALKGSNKEEITESLYAITKMGGKLEDTFSFDLFKDYGGRNILKIKKDQESKFDNLRSYDKIIKKPLKNKNNN